MRACVQLLIPRACRAVIQWLKDELAQAQHRRHPPPPPPSDLFAPATTEAAAAPAPPPQTQAQAQDGAAVKADDAEADANDKRSWMSSAQLWSCGSHDDSTANTNGVAAAAHSKVRNVERGQDSSLTHHADVLVFFFLPVQ